MLYQNLKLKLIVFGYCKFINKINLSNDIINLICNNFLQYIGKMKYFKLNNIEKICTNNFKRTVEYIPLSSISKSINLYVCNFVIHYDNYGYYDPTDLIQIECNNEIYLKFNLKKGLIKSGYLYDTIYNKTQYKVNKTTRIDSKYLYKIKMIIDNINFKVSFKVNSSIHNINFLSKSSDINYINYKIISTKNNKVPVSIYFN